MQIKDIKDLKKLLSLCREMGVDSIKVDNLEVALGSAPQKRTKSVKPSVTTQAANDPFSFENIAIKYQTEADEQNETITNEMPALTEEQLLLWSTNDEPQ